MLTAIDLGRFLTSLLLLIAQNLSQKHGLISVEYSFFFFVESMKLFKTGYNGSSLGCCYEIWKGKDDDRVLLFENK